MNSSWSLDEMIRVSIIEQFVGGLISRTDAAESLGLSPRQVSRIVKRFEQKGIDGVCHGNKRRRPKNTLEPSVQNKIIEVFLDWRRKSDEGVNASHLRDILLRDHQIRVARQTTWRLLRSRGLLIRTRRVRKFRKRRDRRESMGDLLYLDGSPHRWFGEAHSKATLVLCSDDATTRALWGVFVPEENRNSCFEVAYEVFRRFGLPRSFWLDRASQFITTRQGGLHSNQSESPTHWQNAMYNLGVRCIFAHSPQARGRGERINGTFQDRLCAELQFRGISELKMATEFLNSTFIPEYNTRFSVEPKNPTGLWRKPPEGIDLRCVLASRTERRVLNDNTIKHNSRRFQILKQPGQNSMAGRTFEVQEWYDGSIHLYFKNQNGLGSEYKFEEIHREPKYKKISGITDHIHKEGLFKHVYF